MATPYEINEAYYRGLRELGPDAAQDAVELGTPYGEDNLELHIKAGREVAAVLAAHDTSVEAPDNGRQGWIDSMHLTGPLPYRTAEERAIHSGHIADLKSHIRPLGERPTSQEN